MLASEDNELIEASRGMNVSKSCVYTTVGLIHIGYFNSKVMNETRTRV